RAAVGGNSERNRDFGFDFLRLRSASPSPPARRLTKDVFRAETLRPGAAAKELAKEIGGLVGIHLLRTTRPAAPAELKSPGRVLSRVLETGAESCLAKAIVLSAFGLVAQDVIRLL